MIHPIKSFATENPPKINANVLVDGIVFEVVVDVIADVDSASVVGAITDEDGVDDVP